MENAGRKVANVCHRSYSEDGFGHQAVCGNWRCAKDSSHICAMLLCAGTRSSKLVRCSGDLLNDLTFHRLAGIAKLCGVELWYVSIPGLCGLSTGWKEPLLVTQSRGLTYNTITLIWCSAGFLRPRQHSEVGEAALRLLPGRCTLEATLVAKVGCSARWSHDRSHWTASFFSPRFASTQHEHIRTNRRSAC